MDGLRLSKYTEKMDTTQTSVDVLIVGGGPAGLTAALGLARRRRTAVIFNSGQYHDDSASPSNSVITWDPEDTEHFHAEARTKDTTRYETITFRDVGVETLRKTEDGSFAVTDKKGKPWTGKKLILATGVRYIYPDIEGFYECWVAGM